MIVHPIVTTPNPERWAILASALGATVHTHDDGTRLAEFAGGRLSLVSGDSPSVEFGLEDGERSGMRGAEGGDGQLGPAVSVAPLLCTPEVEETARMLAGKGLRRRLTSDSGDWADLAGDGLVGVHVGEVESTVMAFEASDVEALEEPLEQSGFRVALVDEAYGRTLRVEHPDDARQESEIWINETQTDAYGYTRHED